MTGALGFFDSGFGGLSVVREIRRRLPRHDLIYLGDNARTPYGSRTPDVIHQFTLEGVVHLIEHGAELTVLACNTSSSVALRRIQQQYQQRYEPEKRVLGIVIPTAEEISNLSKTKTVGVLATEATVSAAAYPQEIGKMDSTVRVHQTACPRLVPLIEAGELEEAGDAAGHYLKRLLAQSADIDTVLLGCTHYALIEKTIREAAPAHIRVVSQGTIVADKLEDYLRRHPEIARRLGTSGRSRFLTTALSHRIQRLAAQFYGTPIEMETIAIPGGSSPSPAIIAPHPN